MSTESSRAAASVSALKPLRFESVLRSKYVETSLRAAAGIALVLLATWVAYELHLNLAATSLLQLLVVLAVALKVGFWRATIVSVLANCCLDYLFTSPVFSFHISDPQNWVALIVFKFRLWWSAGCRRSPVAGRRSDKASRRTGATIRNLSATPVGGARTVLGPGDFIADSRGVFDRSRRVVRRFQTRLELLGGDTASLEAEARSAYLQDRDSRSSDGRTWVRVLRLGVRPIGAIGLRGDGLTGVTANALASLTAIALERAHSFARVKKAGESIHLTPKEFDLLHYLMANAGMPIAHARRLQSVWGPEYENELEYLRTFVRQLRLKN